MNRTETWKNIKSAIREKFAWPGGYPLYLVTIDGAALCVDCGRKEFKLIAQSHHRYFNDTWRIIGADVNWDDTQCFCDHCGKQIESAYGAN